MSDYAQEWLNYKRRRNQLLIVWLGLPFVLLALMLVAPTPMLLGTSWGWRLAQAIPDLLGMALSVVVYWRLRAWPCPRCGKRFFANSERRGLGILTRWCGECGLRKYSS
jgi:hypothetical protein